jgi:hypothetical protein
MTALLAALKLGMGVSDPHQVVALNHDGASYEQSAIVLLAGDAFELDAPQLKHCNMLTRKKLPIIIGEPIQRQWSHDASNCRAEMAHHLEGDTPLVLTRWAIRSHQRHCRPPGSPILRRWCVNRKRSAA